MGAALGLTRTDHTSGELRAHHVLIGGPTGVGKSWLACALGHKACRDGSPCSIGGRHACSPTLRQLVARGGWRA
jgi:hypothetical protein